SVRDNAGCRWLGLIVLNLLAKIGFAKISGREGLSRLMRAIIEHLFLPGMILGFLSPLLALIAALALYIRHRRLIERERRVPIIAYVLTLIVCGGVAGYVGMGVGIALACPETGNLCGLFGVFVTGPISFSLATVGIGVALSLVRPTASS